MTFSDESAFISGSSFPWQPNTMSTSNTLKTVFLLGLLSAVLLFAGEALAGRQGLYIGLGLAVRLWLAT